MRKGFQGPLARSTNGPPPADFVYNPPTEPWLKVLHQDDDILILSKPAGLLSVPGREPVHHDSLQNRVLAEFPTATIVHRLDRGTSGVFAMALNPNAHRHLGLQFERRHASKHYVALVAGCVQSERGTVDLALRTDWYNRPKQMVDTYMGREAITDWTVMERNPNQTRMLLSPKTGRSHQLRVHMQHLGHPILGDTFYAPAEYTKGHQRMMLHAEQLEVFHPKDGERVSFSDACPF